MSFHRECDVPIRMVVITIPSRLLSNDMSVLAIHSYVQYEFLVNPTNVDLRIRIGHVTLAAPQEQCNV